jgi:hypothetical protein
MRNTWKKKTSSNNLPSAREATLSTFEKRQRGAVSFAARDGESRSALRTLRAALGRRDSALEQISRVPFLARWPYGAERCPSGSRGARLAAATSGVSVRGLCRQRRAGGRRAAAATAACVCAARRVLRRASSSQVIYIRYAS